MEQPYEILNRAWDTYRKDHDLVAALEIARGCGLQITDAGLTTLIKDSSRPSTRSGKKAYWG